MGIEDKGKDDSKQHNPSLPFTALSNKVTIGALVSFFVVVFAVVCLHLFRNWMLRQRTRRRMQGHQFSLGIMRTFQPSNTGLEACIISSLPMFVYGQEDGMALECAVCLSAMEEGEMARLLPNCKHTFHVQCIDEWLHSHSTCPVCRMEAEPQLPSQPQKQEEAVATDGVPEFNAKIGGSSSRLSSFRRMVSRERSDKRVQPCVQIDDSLEDIERQ